MIEELGTLVNVDKLQNGTRVCHQVGITVNCGVPQGSILEPHLFVVYINDINMFHECDYIHLFADDTVLSVNLDE